MRDRSIRDGPRSSRQECAAEEDARMREEIEMELDAAGFTGAELWYDEMVEDTLREMRTPHPALTAEERNPGLVGRG